MSLRRFYRRIEGEEADQQIFFILNLYPVHEECLICYETIEQENVICHECSKPIHLSCLEQWFSENETRKCPHCRSNWRFEIDIIERHQDIIELDEYSVLPRYRNRNKNKITVAGSISGHVPTRLENRINDFIYRGTVTINNNNHTSLTINNTRTINNTVDNHFLEPNNMIRNEVNNITNNNTLLSYQLYQQSMNEIVGYEN